jgi:hypothetical protein
MALGKVFSTPFGVSAIYWKIANVMNNFLAASVKVVLAGYVSKEARLAGAQPIVSQTVDIQGEAYAPELSRASLYAAIKTDPVWLEAEDC